MPDDDNDFTFTKSTWKKKIAFGCGDWIKRGNGRCSTISEPLWDFHAAPTFHLRIFLFYHFSLRIRFVFSFWLNYRQDERYSSYPGFNTTSWEDIISWPFRMCLWRCRPTPTAPNLALFRTCNQLHDLLRFNSIASHLYLSLGQIFVMSLFPFCFCSYFRSVALGTSLP